jgi:2-oxoisovalerate dehydrogenase E1 component alpha subunit
MNPKSRLHVPSPPARPGQAPDFSYVQLSPAGAVPKPEPNARLADLGGLDTSLIRVLDDQHRALGPWDPHLDAHELQLGLRYMLLTRLFDDRMQKIQRQGRMSFYMNRHAVPVLSQPGSAHRARHPLVDLMCQLLSNTATCARDGSCR